MITRRKVSREEAKKLADLNDLLFIEASAKTGENIEKVFMEPARMIMSRIANNEISLSMFVILFRITSKGVWNKVYERAS